MDCNGISGTTCIFTADSLIKGNSNISTIGLYSVLFFAICWSLKKLSWLSHPSYRDPRQPPFVPYTIPFLGSALELRKGPHIFIKKWSEYFQSNVFSAYIAGHTYVFVNDTFLTDYYTSGRIPELVWKDFKFNILKNGMKLSEEGAKVVSEEKNEHRILDKHMLKTESLNDTMTQFQIAIQQKWLPKVLQYGKVQKNDDSSWSSQSILQFFAKILYLTNTEVLFGFSSLATHEFFDVALAFDKDLIRFVKMSQKRQKKLKVGYHAREKISRQINMIAKGKSTNENDKPSPLMNDIADLYDGKMEINDRSNRQLSLHWASYTNAIPTLFWTVFNLLSMKDAYQVIQEEVRSIYRKRKDFERQNEEKKENDVHNNNLITFTLSDINEMKNLDSLLMETIRHTTTQKMIRARRANRDFEVKLPLKEKTLQFLVKKNTMFMSSTTLHHRDPEIFNDPEEFQWDRFVRPGPDGNPPVFTKNGRPLKRPVNPFGAGVSMCPGRKFALSEIKTMIALILVDYDIRFPNGEMVNSPGLRDPKAMVSLGFPAEDVEFELQRTSS